MTSADGIAETEMRMGAKQANGITSAHISLGFNDQLVRRIEGIEDMEKGELLI